MRRLCECLAYRFGKQGWRCFSVQRGVKLAVDEQEQARQMEYVVFPCQCRGCLYIDYMAVLQ